MLLFFKCAVRVVVLFSLSFLLLACGAETEEDTVSTPISEELEEAAGATLQAAVNEGFSDADFSGQVGNTDVVTVETAGQQADSEDVVMVTYTIVGTVAEVAEEVVEEVALPSVTLSWLAPSTRENGEFLNLSEISAYYIRYKKQGDQMYESLIVSDSSAVNQSIEGLETGRYEFSIAAVDVDGLVGEYTQAVYKDI